MENEVKIIEKFHPVIDKKMVFEMLNCYPDSPVYGEVEEAYEAIWEEVTSLCDPRGVIAPGEIPGQFMENCRPCEAIYVLVTIGSKISEYSTKAFAQGEYLKGMLADAMADAALFSLESDIERELIDICTSLGRGINARLEAPNDVPMEIQKEVFEQTNAEMLLGINISEGYMFDPVKTSCNIYRLTKDKSVFQVQHNCRKCDNYKCMLRRVLPLNIRVIDEAGTELSVFTMMEGNLLEALNREIEDISSPCGGRGFCGKCRIQVIDGKLPIKEGDKKAFSETELEAGWRLACQAVPDEDLTIRIGWSAESDMTVLEKFEWQEKKQNTADGDMEDIFGFAVDIGTTTLAIQLISLKSGKCLETYTGLNTQRAFGADVIGRIKAAMEGKQEILKEKIRENLWKGMEKLCHSNNIEWTQVKRIAMAGNTTMIHLLMGYPCDGLSSMPFTPYKIEEIQIDAREIFERLEEAVDVLIYPGITAFVGADIVSGLCALEAGSAETVNLLIDLGTNGEMALGNREKLLVTSTAAGPAFEGGNITWGIGSIPGAICSARMQEEKMIVGTIQNQPPVGICGTGIIELIAELVRAGIVDDTGKLGDEWFEEGYPVAVDPEGRVIRLFQKDIREIQLAKAAILAGIESLLKIYGIEPGEVGNVYVAGGFGYQLDYEKAIAIGMFPGVLKEKIHPVGNSSLYGAAKLLLSTEYLEEAKKIAVMAREVELASNPEFQEKYMDAILLDLFFT